MSGLWQPFLSSPAMMATRHILPLSESQYHIYEADIRFRMKTTCFSVKAML